jgi:hypothetical protein
VATTYLPFVSFHKAWRSPDQGSSRKMSNSIYVREESFERKTRQGEREKRTKQMNTRTTYFVQDNTLLLTHSDSTKEKKRFFSRLAKQHDIHVSSASVLSTTRTKKEE